MNRRSKTSSSKNLTTLPSDVEPGSKNVGQLLSKTLGECNLELLEKQEFCDVFFIVGSQRIGCHKLLLMSRSIVFQTMFADRWNANAKSEVEIVDFSMRVFRTFLKFIYADQFVNTISEAVELLQLADKYDVPLLMDKCKELIQSQITLSDSVNVYQMARKYNLTELQNSACEVMTKNFGDLVKLKNFKSQADEDTVTTIIKQDELPASELEVFKSIMLWKTGKSITPAALKKIIQHVRFPLMSPDEFSTHVVPTGILNNEEVIAVFMYFHADKKARAHLTSKFSSVPRVILADVFIDFYNGPAQQYQISTGSKTVTNQEETLRFQYVSDYSGYHKRNEPSLCSIVLKGPNPTPTSSYMASPNVPTKQETWQVTVTMKENSKTGKLVFEKSNVTISNMTETTVIVHPNVQLVHGIWYFLSVKYNSPVGVTTVQHGYDINPHNFFSIAPNPVIPNNGYFSVQHTDAYHSSTISTYCIRKLGLKESS